MSDDRDPDAPSLEPPSLFRRRRKPKPEPKATPAPGQAPEPADRPVDEEPTVVLPAAEPEPEPAPVPEPARTVAAAPPLYADEVEPAPESTPTAGPTSVPSRPRRELQLPVLSGLTAAVVTGLLVGLVVVGLTAGGQRGCEAVQGTSSCGGAGYPLVLAILVVAVLLGGALLRRSGVPDPGSTSFLAVGLLAVIALLFLVEQLDSIWMVGVIPAIAMATYAASHWVTTAVIEPARE